MTINIVKAKSHHSKKIWEWRNDPTTISMSINNKVISWLEHKKWYERNLTENGIKTYIAKENKTHLGVVRFEQSKSKEYIYEISINVAPEKRGKGIGKIILKNSIDLFIKDNSNCKIIKAKIKSKNIRSIKTFLKCGFEFFEENNEIITLIIKRD